MGDLLAISVLVAFAAVVFREHRAQRADDRSTRESMRVFDAWRDALR
jgi:hypothetical protein